MVDKCTTLPYWEMLVNKCSLAKGSEPSEPLETVYHLVNKIVIGLITRRTVLDIYWVSAVCGLCWKKEELLWNWRGSDHTYKPTPSLLTPKIYIGVLLILLCGDSTLSPVLYYGQRKPLKRHTFFIFKKECKCVFIFISYLTVFLVYL